MRFPAPTNAPLRMGDLASMITSPAWIEWFQRLADYYENVPRFIDPKSPFFGQAAPPNPAEGLLAYADGTNWNPDGSGVAGIYNYLGGVWKFTGALLPAASVSSETAFGILAAIGTSFLYARADHTHGSPTNPVTAHVAASDAHAQYQKESEKDSASGYAGLNSVSRTTKGVDTTDDLIVDLATKGLVLKNSTDGYYFRLTMVAGIATWTNLGATKP